MPIKQETRDKLEKLSILVRKVYGIRDKQKISFKEHPSFVKEVLTDFTNISYNITIADGIKSPIEKELTLLVLTKIFYSDGDINDKFVQALEHQFDTFEIEEPSIKSPILILEQAKKYDKKFNAELEKDIKDLIVHYAEALVMSDGYETIGEFDVLETFKTWVYEEDL